MYICNVDYKCSKNLITGEKRKCKKKEGRKKEEEAGKTSWQNCKWEQVKLVFAFSQAQIV